MNHKRPSVEDIQKARAAGALGEVGTKVPDDTDIERAKRMVTRLHVNAHDARGEGGGLMTPESYASVCEEAADVIELLLGKLR